MTQENETPEVAEYDPVEALHKNIPAVLKHCDAIFEMNLQAYIGGGKTPTNYQLQQITEHLKTREYLLRYAAEKGINLKSSELNENPIFAEAKEKQRKGK